VTESWGKRGARWGHAMRKRPGALSALCTIHPGGAPFVQAGAVHESLRPPASARADEVIPCTAAAEKRRGGEAGRGSSGRRHATSLKLRVLLRNSDVGIRHWSPGIKYFLTSICPGPSHCPMPERALIPNTPECYKAGARCLASPWAGERGRCCRHTPGIEAEAAAGLRGQLHVHGALRPHSHRRLPRARALAHPLRARASLSPSPPPFAWPSCL